MQEETNQIIKNDSIRYQFDEKSNKMYFSIVDVVGIIAKTTNARNYWKVLKNRLNKIENQLVTECYQLKIKASDGKFYLTDVGDKKMILKMVKMAAPEALPYFETYFENLDQNNSLHVVSLKVKKEAPSNNQKHSYPQVKKIRQISQTKIKMKSI